MLKKNTSLPAYYIPIYYFTCLVAACLAGRNIIPHVLAYAALSSIILIALITHSNAFLSSVKFNILKKDAFSTLLLSFLLFCLITSPLHSPTLHPFFITCGLTSVFLFLKSETFKLSHTELNQAIKNIFIIGSTFVYLSYLAVLLIPTKIFNQKLYIYSPHDLFGLEGSPNINAQLLLNIFIISLFTYQLKITKKLIPILIATASIILILWSNSRSAILSSTLLLIASIFLQNKNRVISIFIVFCTFLLLFIFPQTHNYFLRFNQHYNILTNTEGRYGIWQSSIYSLFHAYNWLIGVGLGNQHIIIHSNGYHYNMAHNSLIDILLGTGIIGFTLFLSALISSICHIIKLYIKSKNKTLLYCLFGMLTLIMSSMTQSTLISQLSTSYFLYIFLYFYGYQQGKAIEKLD